MHGIRLVRSLTATVVASALFAASSAGVLAQSSPPSTGAATPEGVVGAYVEAIAANDVESILAASAAEEMAAGFDFQAYAERLQAMTPVMGMAPSEYPMFGALNRYQQASQILGQVRNLAYGLLSDERIDGTVIAPVDAERIAAFVAAVDPARLVGLHILDVRIPEPEAASSARYLDNAARMAAVYGADEMTERLALVELDGDTFGLGFTLLRYDDEWLVSNQWSALGGTSALGTAEPMSREEFEARTGG
jgi:hypothetical protein